MIGMGLCFSVNIFIRRADTNLKAVTVYISVSGATLIQ